MDLDTQTKLAIYHHFAETGQPPLLVEVAERVGAEAGSLREAYARLRAQRVLVLEPDGESIRMAPPFSGVPTQHRIEAGGKLYFANCAWDALGVVAALGGPGTVLSECAQTAQPFTLPVDRDGPQQSSWLFHCLVPAAQWWDDIVFT